MHKYQHSRLAAINMKFSAQPRHPAPKSRQHHLAGKQSSRSGIRSTLPSSQLHDPLPWALATSRSSDSNHFTVYFWALNANIGINFGHLRSQQQHQQQPGQPRHRRKKETGCGRAEREAWICGCALFVWLTEWLTDGILSDFWLWIWLCVCLPCIQPAIQPHSPVQSRFSWNQLAFATNPSLHFALYHLPCGCSCAVETNLITSTW